jgi:subtilisin family serine protease
MRSEPRHRFAAASAIVAVAVANVIVLSTDPSAVVRASGQSQEQTDVLIGFRNTPGASEHALVRAHGGSVKHSFTLVPAIAASLPAQAVAALRANPRVTAIEPDGLVYAVDAFDNELAATWGVARVISSASGNLHSTGHFGAGVRVAVIDTGVAAHSDLAPIAGGWDFVNNDSNPTDDNGHGTHVSGTIAALRNGTGVVGVAPDVEIYALKVLGANGSGSFSNVIAALNWVVDFNTTHSPKILVTNNSYGAAGDPGSIVKAAFDNAEAAGVLNVASAGNSGNCAGTGNTVGFPAQYASTLAVAATDSNNLRACFSSSGPAVGIAAPGAGITSTVPGGGYATWNGTSMASPHVVGAAVQVIAAGVVDLNGVKGVSDEVRNLLTSTATDLGAAGRDDLYGAGLVNALAAVDAVEGGQSAPVVVISSPANGSSFVAGASVSFAGSAVDNEDGNLTAGLSWVSNLDGPIGSGGSFSTTSLSVGTHTVTASVTDSGSATGQDSVQVTVTAPAPPPAQIVLTANGYKVKGLQRVDLSWSGATTNGVDVYRDGVKLLSNTPNDGAQADVINKRGGGVYTYFICEAGSSTACSNVAVVVF